MNSQDDEVTPQLARFSVFFKGSMRQLTTTMIQFGSRYMQKGYLKQDCSMILH